MSNEKVCPFIMDDEETSATHIKEREQPAPNPTQQMNPEYGQQPMPPGYIPPQISAGYAPQQTNPGYGQPQIPPGYPPQQMNPVIPPNQPVIQPPNVKLEDTNHNELVEKESNVLINYSGNFMYLSTLTSNHRTKEEQTLKSYSSVPVNKISSDNGGKIHNTKITDGYVELTQINVTEFKTGNRITDSVTLKFSSVNRKTSEAEVSLEQMNNPKKLRAILTENGVTMLPKGNISDIISFLQLQYKHCTNFKVTHAGYYQESGILRVKGDETIFREALDPSQLISVLGLANRNDWSKTFSLMTYVCIGCLARIVGLIANQYPDLIKVIVHISADNIKAENELIRMYCTRTNPVIKPDKDFSDKLSDNNISLISLSCETDYNKKRAIQQTVGYLCTDNSSTGEHSHDTIAAMVLQDKKLLREYASSEQIMIIPYSPTNCDENAVKIANLFQSLILKQISFIAYLLKNAEWAKHNYIENSDCEEYLIGTYSLIMSAAKILMSAAGISTDDVTDYMEEYCEYLTHIGETSDESAKNILLDFLSGEGRDLLTAKENLTSDCKTERLIGYTDTDIFITPPLFKELAESNGMKKNLFAQNLISDGILSCGDKFQKNVAFPTGGQARLYNIKMDSLFDIGQIRLEPNDFLACPPAIKIEIGLCENRPVYFSLPDRNGSENGHIFITGQSGSGKSYFLRKFAKNAVAQGIEVVVFGTEDTCPDFQGDCEEFAFDTENFGVTKGSYHAFLSPILDSGSLSSEARSLVEMLDSPDDEFSTLSECINAINSLFESEPAANELIEQMQLADSHGVYSSGIYWNNVCRPGQLSVVKSTNDSKEFLDEILRGFYKYKCSQSEVSPCLLILDECQSLSLDQQSALIDLILRQGRKRGIMAVLTSQYLTASDGKNISKAIDQCDTYIAFKPGNSPETAKRLGFRASDSHARDILASVGKYNCVVRGKVATDRCTIDYPLIVRIPK